VNNFSFDSKRQRNSLIHCTRNLKLQNYEQLEDESTVEDDLCREVEELIRKKRRTWLINSFSLSFTFIFIISPKSINLTNENQLLDNSLFLFVHQHKKSYYQLFKVNFINFWKFQFLFFWFIIQINYIQHYLNKNCLQCNILV